MLRGAQHRSTCGLKFDHGREQSRRDALDDAPLPHGSCVEIAAARERASPFEGVTVHEFFGILTHHDAQIVFGLGEQSVGINEFESARGFQGIPLVNVAVHQNSSLGSMRCLAASSALEGVVDHPLAARVTEVLPRGGYEVHQPTSFLRPRGQRTVRSAEPKWPNGLAHRYQSLLEW